MDFFKEWLGELGIESEVTVMESNKLTDMILDGEYDVFQWGWYVEPDPDSILDVLHLRAARRLVRLVVLRPGVRRDVRSSRTAEIDDAKRVEIDQADAAACSSRTRRTS